MENSGVHSSQIAWDVLLVDDDRDDYLLTRSALKEIEGNPIRLHWAGSYDAGMRALADNHFDAVLVDYYLPERNGLDLIREAVEVGHNLPFILLTGLNSYDLDIAAMQAGASDYLPKGDMNPRLLERSLRYAIERHRLIEQNRQERILFQTVFEVNPDGLAVISGEDLTFKLVNPAYRALTPHPEIDPLGQNIDSIWSPVEIFNSSAAIRYILDNQQTVKVDRSDFVYPDGTHHSLAFHLQPYNWQGQPAVLIVLSETTALEEARRMAEKAAEEAERRANEAEEGRRILNAIMEYLPEGLLITEGTQGNIRMVSKHGLQQFSLDSVPEDGQAVGDDPLIQNAEYPDRLVPLPAQMFPLARAVRDGEIIQNEEVALRQPDGSRALISCNAAPIRDAEGRITGGLMAWRDITEKKRDEERLAYQARLLENVHDAILATDDNFKITSWNRAAEELYGWKADEVQGRALGEVIRSEISLSLVQGAMNALTDKDYYRLEVPQYTRAGKRIMVDSSVIALRNAEGQIIGYINANRDVTARIQATQERERLLREVEQQQARLSAIIQNAPVGIFVADNEARILMANPAGERLLGSPLPPGEAYDEPIRQLWYCHSDGTPYAPRDLPLVRSALDGETFENLELHVQFPDGQQRVWLVNSAPIIGANHTQEGAVAIYQDITERRRSAALLQLNAARMEAQRYLTRARETERLEIAHDLHDGPLQDLIGITFRLSEAHSLSPEGELADLISTMQREMQHSISGMRAFCNELRPPALTPFGLERAIRSHAETFRIAHPDLILNLDLDRDRQELSESVRMTLFQVFREALNNIVKHAQASQVTIRLALESGDALLEISDNGRGFQMPKHWVEFARAGHLGLVGMQERAEAVGGQVMLESAQGQGTKLQVRVPFQQPQELLTEDGRI